MMRRVLALTTLSLLALACGEEEQAPDAPRIIRFEASDGEVGPGQRFLLRWEVEGADSVSIATFAGDLLVGGTEQLESTVMAGPLLEDTVFVLRAEGPGGRVGASTLVTVNYAPPSVERFDAQPSVVIAGDPAFLFWQTDGGNDVHITDDLGGLVYSGPDASGTATVTPAVTSVYTVTVTGPGGTATATTGVEVRGAPPVVVAFGAEPAEIFEGDATRLSWRTAGADSVRINANGALLVETSSAVGTFVDTPAVDTEYELIASNADGTDTGKTMVLVRVLEPPKIDGLQAQPTVVGIGGTTTLSWAMSAERYRIFANGVLVTEQLAAGEIANEPVTITSTRTRILVEVENRLGVAQGEVEVLGHRAPRIESFTVTPGARSRRGPVTVTWSVRDVSSLDLLQDGLPAPGFTPVRVTGPTQDAQGSLTFDIRTLSRFELVASSEGGAASVADVSVVGVDELEANDSVSAPMVVTGTSARIRASLSGPNDVDVYRIEVPSDGRLRTRTLSGQDLCLLDTRLTFTSTDGRTDLVVDDDDGIAACSLIEPTLDPAASGLASGFYFLRVEAGTATTSGPYVLELEAGKTVCGDGVVEGTEQCDDGNTSLGDGCSETCQLELIGVVTGPSGTVTGNHPGGAGVITVAVDTTAAGQTILARANDPNAGGCNGVDTSLQLLDDGLNVLGTKADGGITGTAGTCAAIQVPPDTFAANLAVGRHYLRVLSDNGASGQVQVFVTVVNPSCGNGVLESRANEQCDDGNFVAGDGCSPTCRLETNQFVEVEPNDTQALAFASGLQGPGMATIQGANTPSGDDDVFSLTVPGGTTLNLTARTYTTAGMPSGCDSQLTDTRIFVEADGVEATGPGTGELAYNDDIDNPNNIWCSQVTNVPLTGGTMGRTYYVRVQGWRDMQATQYFLRLTLSP